MSTSTIITLSNAVKIPIVCKRANTFVLKSIKFYSDVAKTIPLPIVGYTFRMEVKNESGEVILLFVTPTNFTIHDTNQLDINMSSTGMTVESSPVGDPYSYDLVITDTSSAISTIMYGAFEIQQNITDNA